jgi:hypothetical protein
MHVGKRKVTVRRRVKQVEGTLCVISQKGYAAADGWLWVA